MCILEETEALMWFRYWLNHTTEQTSRRQKVPKTNSERHEFIEMLHPS